MAKDREHGTGQGRAVGLAVVAWLLVSSVVYVSLWTPAATDVFFRLQTSNSTLLPRGDKLQTALNRASMGNNKTVIISILNEAYAEEGGLLDFFLRNLREGEGTDLLIKQLLLVAVDETAFQRCKLLGLNCYRLVTEGVNLSNEVLFMSEGFLRMMWARTRFLGDVLRHGYSFIFTDMDVMWLRNPFPKLSRDGEDMQISCDSYNGNPHDKSNPINTGFYFVASNNRTTALFEEWYEGRKNATGMKEQDVLTNLKNQGAFERLGVKVRFLDTLHFSGFCQDSRNFSEVRTVHANCCRIEKAKLADLSAALEVWKRFNGTGNATWPAHSECHQAWQRDTTNFQLEKSLEKASIANRTLIISVLNKAHAEENGMLDLFLEGLRRGVDTEFLIKHTLFVAVDRIAFSRCKLLNLHCYQLATQDFSSTMWQSTRFLVDVLRLGYNFIFTDPDVMWLRNPFSKLALNGEDMQVSCDKYNRKPLNASNTINTGLYFVTANQKTIALFETWSRSKNNSKDTTEQDTLNRMRADGAFTQFDVKVKFLDSRHFSSFCEDSGDLREVSTVRASCCQSLKAKLDVLRDALEAWKSFNNKATVRWPEHKECQRSRLLNNRV